MSDVDRAAWRRYMRDEQRRRRLAQYAEEIPLLEERITLAEERDEGQAYIRRLQRKIAHRRRRLAEGWPDEPTEGQEERDS